MLNEQTTDPHQTESVPGQSIRFGGSFYEFGQLIPLFGSDFVFPLIIYFAEEFYSNAPSEAVWEIGGRGCHRRICVIQALDVDAAEPGADGPDCEEDEALSQ